MWHTTSPTQSTGTLHSLQEQCNICLFYHWNIFSWCCKLEQAQVSIKKLKKIAAERSEDLRANFIRHMAQYRPEQLGFLNEVLKDERTLARLRGWSIKGRHAVKKGVFVQGRRFSAEGLLTVDGMVSNTVVEGSMTKNRFQEYLEHSVVHHISRVHRHYILCIPLCCLPSCLYAHRFLGT